MAVIRGRKPKTTVTTKKAEPAKKATPKNVKPLTLKPRASEKAYGLSELHNTYIFDVDKSVNKLDIATAVSAQYEVGVVKVRMVSVPGKSVRSYRNRGRKSINGQRSDTRKAYVTLKEGDKLPIFAAVEEAEAPKETK